jgi:hypothetical protein
VDAKSLIFATYVEEAEDLWAANRLAESLRTFGGKFKTSQVWCYIPDHLEIGNQPMLNSLAEIGVEMHRVHVPEESRWLFYAGKVYASEAAELLAAQQNSLLVWVDADTMILHEPSDFALKPTVKIAYCPVMHNRSGTLYGQPPDNFWSRIYEKLDIPENLLFPMITPADNQKIRAYFHCGLLVVRPECGILSQWARDFETLYRDMVLTDMCRHDITRRIFLHQTALTGAVLHNVARHEMLELPATYNYPVFFDMRYEAEVSFNSIQDVVTLRCVVSSRDAGPDWHLNLQGPPDRIAWLKERLFRE